MGALLGARGAAMYAVWMAKPGQLGLLTDSLFWSWKGHVIRALSDCEYDSDSADFLELNPEEKLIYLKYYLEASGALLLSLARELVMRGCISSADLNEKDLLDQSLFRIWEEYLSFSTNIREQVQLRQRLQRQQYDRTTRRHKTYPHLIPLVDAGLVSRNRADGNEVFSPVVHKEVTPLEILVEAYPTVRDMEVAIENGEHTKTLASVMVANHRKYSQDVDSEVLLHKVIQTYQVMRSNGAVIHAIDAIADVCYAQMLLENQVLITRREIDRALYNLQMRFPQEVRFHVDRMGRPAFLLLDDELVAELLVT